MGKRCRSCDVENVDEAKFCLQCGSSLSDETPPMRSDIAPHVACAACGHINVELSAFCSECGEHLESPTPRAPGRKAFGIPPRFARPLAAAVVIVVAALLVGGVVHGSNRPAMPSRCPAGGTGVPQLRQRSLRLNPPAQRRCVSRLRRRKNIVSSKVKGTLEETSTARTMLPAYPQRRMPSHQLRPSPRMQSELRSELRWQAERSLPGKQATSRAAEFKSNRRRSRTLPTRSR